MAISTIDTEASSVRPRMSASARPQPRVANPFTLPPVERETPAPRAPAQGARGSGTQASDGQGADPARPKATERTPRRDPPPARADRKPEASVDKLERARSMDASRSRPEPAGQTAGGSEPVPKIQAASADAAPGVAEAAGATPIAEPIAQVAEGTEEVEEEAEDGTQGAAPTPLPFLAVTTQAPPPIVPGLAPPAPPGQAKTGTDPAAASMGAEAVAEGAAPAAPLALRVQAGSGRGEGSEGEGRAKADESALPPIAQGSTDAPALADLLPAPPPAAHARNAEAAAPAPAHSAATTGAAVSVPLGAVPMTIGLRALSGSNTFEIRLDPKDLGRIEVNLAIDTGTNTVQATLRVDRPETLALLQRDASSLQQALSQAGLDVPDGGISLSLRSDGGSGGSGSGFGETPSGTPGRPGRDESGDPPLPMALPLRLYGGGRGLDIRI